MRNVIEFKNVSKKFRKGEKFNSLRDAIPDMFKKINSRERKLEKLEFWAVKDASFEIPERAVVGIMGPNGAGKSTILKLLSRIMAPTRGSININGRLSALIEITAGFHPELTGRENVYLNGTIIGMKKKEIDAKFDTIVDFSGVGEFIDTPVKRYSSGMFSRLGFSVAAHMDPDILLVDEVLSVGDIAFQAKCADKMRELLKTGATIVLVSHNISLVQSLCQRIILLDQGAVLKDAATSEVIPYYENIVLKKREEEFKRKIQTSPEYKVKINTDTFLKILSLSIRDDTSKSKEIFNVGDAITIEIRYAARKRIDRPIFCLDIVRADGVVCCSIWTKDSALTLDYVDGEGIIKVNLGAINLTPGIYLLKVSAWDQDIIHPFDILSSDFLRITTKKSRLEDTGIFIPSVTWSTYK